MYGFEIISEHKLPELKAKGIFAVHKTGLEVYHILNKDEENLFCFGFTTPPKSSNGVAHIIEHTVLCGSKNFPLKDPFLTLEKQSINTFLNAMTYPDKTLYPASSIVKADYFNLMAVYGDAVFFPRLERWAFEQEGYRFEYDEKKRLSLQGVVFNEMMANYSDFDNVAFSSMNYALFKDSIYAFDSGGDPRVIPDLTYEEYRAFYDKYYHPSNCKVFLCGNIPTETQLKFLNEKFLQFVEPRKKPEPLPEIPVLEKPIEVKISAPANADSQVKCSVVIGWRLGETKNIVEMIEALVLQTFLIGHDGSPLNKALIDSDLGELSAYNSISASCKNAAFFFGLSNVKKGYEEKVPEVIFNALHEILNTEIDDEKINTALNSIDFANREIVRSGGAPFSLTLMMKAFNSWNYGGKPEDAIRYISVFTEVKNKILADKNYIKTLIRELLIENQNRCTSIIYPDKKYAKKLEKVIKQKVTAFEKTLTKADIQNLLDLQKLNDEKKLTPDSEELQALIPHLSKNELPRLLPRANKSLELIGGVPALVHKQPTNGIAYLDIAFPIDNIADEDYEYVKLFASSLLDVGTESMSWSENINKAAQLLGGMGVNLLSSTRVLNQLPEILENQNIVNNDCILGRDWLYVSIKMLGNLIEESCAFIFNLIQNVSFKDHKRLLDNINQTITAIEGAPAVSGHMLALVHSMANTNHHWATTERWNGVTQLHFLKKLRKKLIENPDYIKVIAQKFQSFHKIMIDSGMILNLTGTKENLKVFKKVLPDNLKNYSGVIAKPKIQHSNFFELKNDEPNRLYLVPSEIQVGHSVLVFKTSPYSPVESGKKHVFSKWLSSGPLWERIRTIGGAYGAFTINNSLYDRFAFITYRDPTPVKSLGEIINILEIAAKQKLTATEMEKLIVGTYNVEVTPKTPYAKSFSNFSRMLQGLPDKVYEEVVDGIISATAEDMQYFAKELLQKKKQLVGTVIAEKERFENPARAFMFTNTILEKEI